MSNHELLRRVTNYHRPVPPGAKTIDIYRVLVMFGVTDPCLQHAAKKILCAGQRGGGRQHANAVHR